MTIEEFYNVVGGDYQKVLNRLVNQMLVKKYLRKFVDDPSVPQLRQALAENDFASAFRGAHTLKGLAATLGLDELAAVASDLTEQLRYASGQPPVEYVRAVEQAYQKAVEAIGQLE